jgi:hypothetical protein
MNKSDISSFYGIIGSSKTGTGNGLFIKEKYITYIVKIKREKQKQT